MSIQYGPSRPEFLNIAGPAAAGFVWSTVLGAYADAQGMKFRKKYAAKHPGVIGLYYTGSAYDTTYILKNTWANAEPENFKAVADYVRTHPYRGVDGAGAGSRAWQARPGEHYLASTGERGGLWRHRGRPPQKLVGVGFTSEANAVSRLTRNVVGAFPRPGPLPGT